jgi:hypothetical protein
MRGPGRYGGDCVLVARHLADGPPARGVPQAHDAVGAAGHDEPAFRQDGEARGEARVARPRTDGPPRGEVPQGEGGVFHAHDEEAQVGEKGE